MEGEPTTIESKEDYSKRMVKVIFGSEPEYELLEVPADFDMKKQKKAFLEWFESLSDEEREKISINELAEFNAFIGWLVRAGAVKLNDKEVFDYSNWK